MKNSNKVVQLMVLVALISFIGAPAARADFETVGHQVTVTVPEVLSIAADTSAFTLTFADNVSGAETDTKTVVYTVESNDMGQADGSAAINANLDFAYTDVDFKAQVGSYGRISGNTDLAAANAGYVTIGTSNTAIANKDNTDAGTDGKLLNGTLPVTYKAVATGDLPTGSQVHFLFITLTTR
jgi:hypothetical protein